MTESDYIAPTTVDAAVAALDGCRGSAMALAGGTDLLVQMRTGRVRPDLIVDLKRIPELIGIRVESGAFLIGAATPCATIGEHAELARAWPGVVEAATLIGSTQVQGRASLGGNLCNASPAADSVPALIAAGAACVIVGPSGRREAPVESIQAGPGRNALARGEILVAIRLPLPPARSGDAYLRLIPRTEMDIAVVGAGVSLSVDPQGVVTACARRARRGGSDHAAGRRRGRDADRLPPRGRRAVGARRRGACGLPTDRRQARHRGVPHEGRGRAGPTCGTDRLRKGSGMSKRKITAWINGEPTEFLGGTRQSLLDALRDELHLTGTKEGCGTGDCGACSIVVDGRLVCACLMLAPEAQDRRIETIEGMAADGVMHPLQRQFLEHAALQCGFCTPGLLVAAKALLERNPDPTESEIRYWLAGNLCRCTGYDKVVRAVVDAAAELRQAEAER